MAPERLTHLTHLDVQGSASIARGNAPGVRSTLGLTQGQTSHLTTHFYTPGSSESWGVRLWVTLARPTFTHATVEVDGVILFDQPYDAPGGWYESRSHRLSRPPTASLDLSCRRPFGDVERAGRGIEGRYTQRVRSASNVLISEPVWPRNCVTSCCELLCALGVWVSATTPDDLWSEICRIVGRTDGLTTTRPDRQTPP